jgi:putative membrane protein
MEESSKPVKIDRQREHQANERTFLAWIRTSIALIGFGLALARFGLFLQQLEFSKAQEQPASYGPIDSQTIGIALVIAGILLVLLAAWNYSRVFYQIERGDYKPSRIMVWLATTIVLVLGLLSLLFVVLRSLPVRQPASSHSQNNRASRSLDAWTVKRDAVIRKHLREG